MAPSVRLSPGPRPPYALLEFYPLHLPGPYLSRVGRSGEAVALLIRNAARPVSSPIHLIPTLCVPTAAWGGAAVRRGTPLGVTGCTLETSVLFLTDTF